jgi:hypothetical protein
MNALSFSFLKFLKLLGFTTRWYYTSFKGNYGEVEKSIKLLLIPSENRKYVLKNGNIYTKMYFSKSIHSKKIIVKSQKLIYLKMDKGVPYVYWQRL